MARDWSCPPVALVRSTSCVPEATGACPSVSVTETQLGSAFAENQAGRRRQVPRRLLRWELIVSQVLICHGHVGGPHAGRVLWRRGGAVRTGYSSLLGQPDIIQPAFPSGDAGSTPKDSTNFGSNQSYWKKKNPVLHMYVLSGFLLLFLLLVYLDRVLLCSPG